MAKCMKVLKCHFPAPHKITRVAVGQSGVIKGRADWPVFLAPIFMILFQQ